MLYQEELGDEGYQIVLARNGMEALEKVLEAAPDLIVLDIRMPVMDGITALKEIRKLDTSVKVIMVTALEGDDTVKQAYENGAVDYVRKPFNLDYLEHDVIEKVNAQLFGDLRTELDEKNKLVEQLAEQVKQIGDLNEKLTRNFYQTILSLANALETRDQYTHGHSERVDLYSKIIAQQLRDEHLWNMIDDEFMNALHVEARLHDIGKIAIADGVLNKPGRLTDDEFDQIKLHPVQSSKILAPLEDLKVSANVICHHHERVDGKGYPSGLKKDDIPVRARIIAVADAYDAMTSDRSYRKAMPIEAAMEQLEKGKGTQFDEEMVDAFMEAFKAGKLNK
ncbi:MAG: response regulator [Candidatus Heimdallarchaeota archaeon]|nr:response regulator [Candidatus Heimdallarchaeota archaeon]